MGLAWTEYFFQGCPPGLITLFQNPPQSSEDFRRFSCDVGCTAEGRANTALRSEDQAETIIRRSGLNPAKFSAHEVQRQSDPFLNEARALEHLDRFCPASRRIYFPQYLGVITDIKRSEYPSIYVLRRRAVVLEAIYPRLSSRRIFAETDHDDSLAQEFYERLSIHIPNISQFEKDWYASLFRNRLRQITTLHDIGIIHGDVRDDHFRLPKDYYDTVLYDFSVSYTFSPSMPCRRRRRRPFLTMAKIEKQQLQEILFHRQVLPLDFLDLIRILINIFKVLKDSIFVVILPNIQLWTLTLLRKCALKQSKKTRKIWN
ncbi:hypothetical protein MW887_000240 [Aspergillus wentii]|nr:hypothetical protein MW887_000240 [Aspergillus wentii]